MEKGKGDNKGTCIAAIESESKCASSYHVCRGTLRHRINKKKNVAFWMIVVTSTKLSRTRILLPSACPVAEFETQPHTKI